MVIRQMYLFDPPEGLKRFRPNPLLTVLSGVTMLGVVFVGVYPAPLFEAADRATENALHPGRRPADRTLTSHAAGPFAPRRAGAPGNESQARHCRDGPLRS
jgi:hypothetical protein